MAILGYYAVVFDDADQYRGVWFGRTEEEAIKEVKFHILDTYQYGEVTPGVDDVMPTPNSRVQFPVGDKTWTAEVGEVKY